MDAMHSLLKRQLKRHLLDLASIPPQWQALINDVNSAYREFDVDRRMVERSLELSSQELVDANSQMRAVFQAIPDLVLRLDPLGTILDIKAGAASDLMIHRQESVGRRLQDTPLKDVAQQLLAAVQTVIAENTPVTFEYSAWPQGQETHYEARLVPLQEQQAVVIIRDITQRKHADRLAQEALFQAAADQAPQVMWIADIDGKVTYLNRSWYELVGGAPPQWHGDQWMEAVLPEDAAEMREKWASVSQDGGVFAGIRRVRAADGSLHTLSYRASPVLDARGDVTCWIGMDADITENKAIEEALRLSNRELEAFSYSVSHDLRAPLSAIDGFSQLLAEQLDPQAPPRVHHYVSRIRNGAAHMSQLIESLLALAQISRKTLLSVPVDLSVIADAALANLQSRDPQRQVSVTVERNLLVKGDAGLLAIAMENLLGNAWKFTSHSDNARISVGRYPKKSDAETVFFVSDNGAGFDMDYAHKLFGTFQRLHTATEFPGTGVGLATVKRVIARHGGNVWGESLPGQGATFFFTLPDTHTAGLSSNSLFNRKNDSRFGPL